MKVRIGFQLPSLRQFFNIHLFKKIDEGEPYTNAIIGYKNDSYFALSIYLIPFLIKYDK